MATKHCTQTKKKKKVVVVNSVVWSEDVLKNVLSCPQPKDRSWDQRVSLKNDSKCIFWIISVAVKNS